MCVVGSESLLLETLALSVPEGLSFPPYRLLSQTALSRDNPCQPPEALACFFPHLVRKSRVKPYEEKTLSNSSNTAAHLQLPGGLEFFATIYVEVSSLLKAITSRPICLLPNPATKFLEPLPSLSSTLPE